MRSRVVGLLVGLVAFASVPASPGHAVPPDPAAPVQPCAALATVDYPYAVESRGTVRASMVFVDFPDAPGHAPTEQVYEQLAQAADWFSQSSYGQLRLEIVPVHGWRRMSRPSSEYRLNRADESTWQDQRDYMQEAAELADADHDFSGSRILYVVAPAGADQDFSPALTFNPGDLVQVDGTDIHAGSPLGGNIYEDGGRLGPKVLLHETGHLLGERDYYDLSAQGSDIHRFVGPWDPMGSMFEARDFMAWTKFRLGWLRGERVRCVDVPAEQTLTLSPMTRGEGLTAVIVPTGRSNAYVLEARHPEGRDASACSGGLLVSRVDETRANHEGLLRVEPAAPDREEDIPACGQLHAAPFRAGDRFTATGLVVDVVTVADTGEVTLRLQTAGLGEPFTGDPDVISRVDGPTPLAVAVALSRLRFDDQEADYAVLSRHDEFADSLAGAPLTAEGPLLLTPSDRLDDLTAAEIRRVVRPGGLVYLLGGEQALGGEVAAAVRDEGLQVRRLAGATRIQTAVEIAHEVRTRFDTVGTASLARAYGLPENPTAAWADSVTGGAWAAARRLPLLLTGREELHPDVADWLAEDRTRETVLFGGTAALSQAVADAAPAPRRVAGAERAATAAGIATELFASPVSGDRRYVITNGYHPDGWAYGLAAAGVAADRGAPLLVVQVDAVPPATQDLVNPCGAELAVIGGTDVVGQEAVRELAEACPTAQ